jgi:anti-sigma factor RsiW
MSCESVCRLLPAYGDNELGIESALEVERHLRKCASCHAVLERQRAFAASVGRLYPRAPLPPGLEERVQSALGSGATRRPWLNVLALAASAVLVLAGLWRLTRASTSGVPATVLAATTVHRSADREQLSLAINTADAAAVNTWLAGALPFRVDTPVRKTADIALQGAATVDLAGERAGYVEYRHQGQPISLFLLPPRAWPASGRLIHFRGIDFRLFRVNDLNVIVWNHPPLSYMLVSKLEAHGARACAVCHSSATEAALLRFADKGEI